MNYTKLLQIKITLNLNNNHTETEKGESVYNLKLKYDLIFDCIV